VGLLRLIRRFPRVGLETSVALSYEGKPLLATATDICEGGLGLRISHAPPPEGAEVRLSLFLPGHSEPFAVRGVVNQPSLAFHDGIYRFGISFIELSIDARRTLRRYINTRRFLHGELRAPSTNPAVEKRMTERLGRARRQEQLM
jgi:c-di-GMP-binding flagellar brake protein YcgR